MGQNVTFTLTAYANRTFTGTVATIVPAGTTTSNVVTYSVLIGVDPTDVQLLPSMTATVTIITQQVDDALLVPNAAISNGRVSVLRNGSPVAVPVQTGITDGVNTQIVSGLQAGERVVTGTSTASSRSASGSGSGNIFGFGPPGGGNNRQGGQQRSAPGGAGGQG